MLAKKYPELKKPVRYSKKMSLLEMWRDIQFHKNLWKVDERMLLLQAKIDAQEEIARNLKAMGDSLEKIQAVTGLSLEEITRL